MQNLISGITVMILLFLTGACSSKDNGHAPTTPMAQAGGSTDVGSGGNGAQAEWMHVAEDLAVTIPKVIITDIDPRVLAQIKSSLPTVIRNSVVQFVDHPLIFGIETATDPEVNSLSELPSTNCSNTKSGPNLGLERDAINFRNSLKIKVNRNRFSCYDKASFETKRLVLHEYLGLLGITELKNGVVDYKLTNLLLDHMHGVQIFDDVLPVVLIHNCHELQDIGYEVAKVSQNAKDYQSMPRKLWRLAHDIDCVDTRNWNGGRGFINRMLFGHFDGDGFAIRGLYSDQKGAAGLFQAICAHCRVGNLNLVGTEVYGNAVVTSLNYGEISNTAVEGKIFSNSCFRVGGIASTNYGKIQYTQASVQIEQDLSHSSADHYKLCTQKLLRGPGELTATTSGVFAGWNANGIIAKSSAKGSIDNVGALGGFVGVNGGIIEDSESSVQIRGTLVDRVGGFVAHNYGKILRSHAHGEVWLVDAKFRQHRNVSAEDDFSGVGGFAGVVSFLPDLSSIMDPAEQLDPVDSTISDSDSDVSICGGITVEDHDGIKIAERRADAFVGVKLLAPSADGAKPSGNFISNSFGKGLMSAFCLRSEN